MFLVVEAASTTVFPAPLYNHCRDVLKLSLFLRGFLLAQNFPFSFCTGVYLTKLSGDFWHPKLTRSSAKGSHGWTTLALKAELSSLESLGLSFFKESVISNRLLSIFPRL